MLLPTASVWHDPALAKGQAEWHPFREPDIAQPVDTPRGANGGAAQPNKRIEAEIREMIADYSELAAEGTIDEYLDYYLEEQHDALRPWLQAATDLTGKLAELRRQLETKVPEAKDRVTRAFAVLQASTGLGLAVESLTVVSDTEATGKTPSGFVSSICRFQLVDEDWYIKVDKIENLSQLKPALDLVLAAYDGWLQGLDSGLTAPERILEQIEDAAETAETTRRRLGLDQGVESDDTGP